MSLCFPEEVVKPPSLYVMVPSEEERSNNTATFVCLARDFSPPDHKFSWKHNGKHVEENNSCQQDVSKAINYTASSYLVLSDNDWMKGTTITCLFEHKTGTKSKTVTRQTGDNLKPSIVLYPPLWKGKEGDSMTQLLCAAKGIDMKDVKVEWTVNGKPAETEPETQGQISELQYDSAKWSKGSNYTCRMKSNVVEGDEWTEESIQVCSGGYFLAPDIQLLKSHLRHIIASDKVVVTCRVVADRASQVSWWVDNKKETSHITQHKEPNGRIISNLTLAVSTWKQLREVKCKVEHPCYPDEKTITIPEPTKQKVTVSIRRPLKDWQKNNGIVLECLLGKMSSHEALVTLQANGQDLSEMQEYVDIPIQKEQRSLTAVRFTIPEDQRRNKTVFACKVTHDEGEETSSPTGELFNSPTLDVTLAPGLSPSKLLCIASGFNPQLEWKFPNLSPQANTKFFMEDNGRLTVISEADMPQKEWYKGMKFTCEVKDQSYDDIRNISICSVFPHTTFADIYVTGPPLNSTANSNTVPVTCLVVGFNVSDLSIVWRVSGKITSDYRMLPVFENNNGTQSMSSMLSLQASAWHGHTDISCEVKRDCDPRALVKHISKTKDMRRPMVNILKPSDDDLIHPNSTSLLCMVTGFKPADVMIHWEFNGKQLPDSRYANGPVSKGVEVGTYTTYSRLPLYEDEGSFTCVVTHGSSSEPTSATVENVFASVVHSEPTISLLRTKEERELVCLVFGYSPANISITWLKNSIVVEAADQQTSPPSRGPDGKFSIHSHLNMSANEWNSWIKFTCNVSHKTGQWSVSISKPEPKKEVPFIDENLADAVPEDTVSETMNMTWSFLVLFLFCLLYSCIVTLIKVK